MDLTNLSKTDQLRGFQALRENPFFLALIEAVSVDRKERKAVLAAPVTPENLYEYFRAKGFVEGFDRAVGLLDLTIVGLEIEVREEEESRLNEKEGQNNAE